MITISKEFNILVESTEGLETLGLDKHAASLTANVDYFYRTPERWEACADVDVKIASIEICYDITGEGDFNYLSPAEVSFYLDRDENEFEEELKEAISSEILFLDMKNVEDGEEVELFAATQEEEKEEKNNEIAKAISLLQEIGYAVATTALDNAVLSDLDGDEVNILTSYFCGKTTNDRLYLVLSHLEEDFEELPDRVKPIVEKIISSVPQKSGRPELVLIETE